MKKIIFIAVALYCTLYAKEFSYRKYEHVKEFYSLIAKNVTQLSIKHNVPPAAILAVAGLESGYGSGYVSKITGNILSLGANKADAQLPALYLPYCKKDKQMITVFDPKVQQECGKNNLIWKQRPPSYKKDYRPVPYAGTSKNLALLKYDPKLKAKAELECVNDFLTNWLNVDYRYSVFKDARIWLNNIVKKEGKAILFTKKTNMEFINKIGGIPNSFNYRKSWPKKVAMIMNKVGLVELTNDIYNKKMSFEQSWKD